MNRLPTLTPREVVSALKRAGFVEAHTRARGSHAFLWHPGTKSSTTVAMHARDIPRPTLRAIIKQAGLTEEEFLSYL